MNMGEEVRMDDSSNLLQRHFDSHHILTRHCQYVMMPSGMLLAGLCFASLSPMMLLLITAPMVMVLLLMALLAIVLLLAAAALVVGGRLLLLFHMLH